MTEDSRADLSADNAFWSWLAFWLQYLVFAVLALAGAGFAALGDAPGDYAAGMSLTLGSLALAFLRLKHHLDSGDPSWHRFLFVSDMKNLAVAIPLFTILGLGGLVVARTLLDGSLYAVGIAFFVVCAIVIFLNIKHVFDRLDFGGH
jgi:hypothetical protein